MHEKGKVNPFQKARHKLRFVTMKTQFVTMKRDSAPRGMQTGQNAPKQVALPTWFSRDENCGSGATGTRHWRY